MNEDEDDFDDDDEEDEYLFGDDKEEEDLVVSYKEGYDGLDEQDDDEEDEDYDEEDEENPEDSYEFDEEDERAAKEDQDRCMMCDLSGVKTHDRWNFRIKDDTGAEEPAWICRHCHGQFASIEQFNKFAENILFRRLYLKASMLLRMIALGAPVELISKVVISGLTSVLFWTDEYGGSEEVRKFAREHLKDVAEKYLGD